MMTIPNVNIELLSDDLYNKCMEMAKQSAGDGATQWIHLADAVSIGTISPMEAYDAISLGYLPDQLSVRDSRYSHLLR